MFHSTIRESHSTYTLKYVSILCFKELRPILNSEENDQKITKENELFNAIYKITQLYNKINSKYEFLKKFPVKERESKEAIEKYTIDEFLECYGAKVREYVNILNIDLHDLYLKLDFETKTNVKSKNYIEFLKQKLDQKYSSKFNQEFSWYENSLILTRTLFNADERIRGFLIEMYDKYKQKQTPSPNAKILFPIFEKIYSYKNTRKDLLFRIIYIKGKLNELKKVLNTNGYGFDLFDHFKSKSKLELIKFLSENLKVYTNLIEPTLYYELLSLTDTETKDELIDSLKKMEINEELSELIDISRAKSKKDLIMLIQKTDFEYILTHKLLNDNVSEILIYKSLRSTINIILNSSKPQLKAYIDEYYNNIFSSLKLIDKIYKEEYAKKPKEFRNACLEVPELSDLDKGSILNLMDVYNNFRYSIYYKNQPLNLRRLKKQGEQNLSRDEFFLNKFLAIFIFKDFEPFLSNSTYKNIFNSNLWKFFKITDKYPQGRKRWYKYIDHNINSRYFVLYFNAHPTVSPAQFVNSFKMAMSKRIINILNENRSDDSKLEDKSIWIEESFICSLENSVQKNIQEYLYFRENPIEPIENEKDSDIIYKELDKEKFVLW